MIQNKSTKKLIVALAALSVLVLAMQAFSQSSNSTLGGTVADASQAVLPGATVTATNTQTGVATTTLTNNAGAYNFPSLQPGIYKITVEMTGFQTTTKTDAELRASGRSTVNFELQVKGVTDVVEITSTAQEQLIESSSSTGTVLESQMITNLPLVNNDVMDLINIMGGTVPYQHPIWDAYNQTFAGVNSFNINLQRDGITINEPRYNSGIVSPSRINPEMVGEFKMILSPVDAEMGRGAGQVQIMTRSGANAYHGSAIYNIQNSSLDANEFDRNRNGTATKDESGNLVWNPQKPDWRNLTTYTLTASGPIKKNKTFFFATWDQAIARSRTMITPLVLTPCAKKGIYRFFSGWNNGNLNQTFSATGTPPVRRSVDANGTPLDARFTSVLSPDQVSQIITTMPNGTSASSMQYASVFGPLSDSAKALVEQDLLNCSKYDPYTDLGITSYYEGATPRRVLDTGFIPRFSAIMPLPNNYEQGDGLNRAAYRWLRGGKGSDTVFGSGEDNNRKNITTKIDHNISDRHRVSGTLTMEWNKSEDARMVWPDSYPGTVTRYPKSFTVSATSTLRPTLLNEGRFGLSRTVTHTNNPIDSPGTGEELRAKLLELLPTQDFPNYNDALMAYPRFFGPGDSSHIIGTRGSLVSTWGGTDDRWTAADTVTWTRGGHSFKFGAEYRYTQSNQDNWGSTGFSASLTRPVLLPAFTPNNAPSDITAAKVPGLVGYNFWYPTGQTSTNFGVGTVSQIPLYRDYLAGAVGQVQQYFFVNDPEAVTWNDPSKGELVQLSDMRYKEFSVFFKDDWKFTPSLTLNLGLRWEYYGRPWVESGLTVGLDGGFSSIMGISGWDFKNWMSANPTQLGDEYLTKQIFIGPNSPRPDIETFNRDLNNFGPAVGFAWQLPWFGKGKTVLRGGYQLTYSTVGNATSFMSVIGTSAPGTNYTMNYYGTSADPYMSFATISNYVPVRDFIPANIKPLNVMPLTDRGVALTVYDPDVQAPENHSVNMSISRTLGTSVTLDVRYVSTMARKQITGLNLNTPNWIDNGLIDAFFVARKGGTTPLLDNMFRGIQINNATILGTLNNIACGTTGGPTGGQCLMAIAAANLATGNFNSVATTLGGYNYVKNATLNTGLPTLTSTEQGAMLRYNGFPANFVFTNPQLSSATYQSNFNMSNYNSMQVQVTVRPTRGFNMTGTYTWSKQLGLGGYTDVRKRELDYRISGYSRPHQFNTYATLQLPFGSNGFFFRTVQSPIVKRLIEGWQVGWILSLATGRPGSLGGATTTLHGNAQYDIVRPDLFDPKSGYIIWEPGAREGVYSFGGKSYIGVRDPSCTDLTQMDPLLHTTANCNHSAFALQTRDADGNIVNTIVAQQAKPGTKGNYDGNTIVGPASFSLDMNMMKAFQLTEGKSFTLRVDASNILNHPTPSNNYIFGNYPNARYSVVTDPSYSVSQTAGSFGRIQNKTGHRTFEAKLTLRF